ncbi:hypothetical protein [Streptomyces sp. NPDC005969]|uniref:hypothetical protein n=1 Tax=Streptomyces sp. NPDC005969 TaxID=3156722 RepID=UPI0033F13118
MPPFLRRSCARCGFLWSEQLAPADEPEIIRLTFWQRITRPFRPKAPVPAAEPETRTGTMRHPDGMPYRYSEIVAEGWERCDGCRIWGQWTAEKPHDCPGPYIKGPSQADGRRLFGEAP